MTDPLALAKTYPYARPAHSYLYVDGQALELVRIGADPVLDGEVRLDGRAMPVADALAALELAATAPLAERVAVLAYGSNAAPTQLARKFADLPGTVIPVLRAELADHDVVYSAHFSRYGAIPATLAVSPGTMLETAVAYLTEAQLARLDETELGPAAAQCGSSAGNYVHGRIEAAVKVDGGAALDAIGAYVSRHGALGLIGAPLALAQVAARGRRFAAHDKLAVLELARAALAPDQGLDEFLRALIGDASLRRAYSERMRAGALDVTPRLDRR